MVVDAFSRLDEDIKIYIIEAWREMGEAERSHFINQVALALSVWGSDEEGRKLVVDVLMNLVADECVNLVDFSLYVHKLVNGNSARNDKIRRVSLILEGYRLKNKLPDKARKMA